MAFEYSTIDDIRKIAERLAADTAAFDVLRTGLWSTMHVEVSEDRIMLTELANRVDRLTLECANLCGVISAHLADVANLKDLEG